MASKTVAQRVAQLEADRDLMAWLFNEMIFTMRVAAAAKMAERYGPEVQRQIVAKMLGR